jgi:DNA polymerase V
MIELGIQNGDLLVVDRSLTPVHGDVVVTAVNGELTCKVLDLHKKRFLAANNHYPPININDSMDVLIEGVVVHSIRHHRVRAG